MGNVRDFAALIDLVTERHVPPPHIDRCFLSMRRQMPTNTSKPHVFFGKSVLEHQLTDRQLIRYDLRPARSSGSSLAAYLILDDPDRRNALSDPLLDQLSELLTRALRIPTSASSC